MTKPYDDTPYAEPSEESLRVCARPVVDTSFDDAAERIAKLKTIQSFHDAGYIDDATERALKLAAMGLPDVDEPEPAAAPAQEAKWVSKVGDPVLVKRRSDLCFGLQGTISSLWSGAYRVNVRFGKETDGGFYLRAYKSSELELVEEAKWVPKWVPRPGDTVQCVHHDGHGVIELMSADGCPFVAWHGKRQGDRLWHGVQELVKWQPRVGDRVRIKHSHNTEIARIVEVEAGDYTKLIGERGSWSASGHRAHHLELVEPVGGGSLKGAE